MKVQRDALLTRGSLRNGHGNTKNGVCAEFTLVRSAVKLDQEVIDFFLLSDLEPGLDEFGCDDFIDV